MPTDHTSILAGERAARPRTSNSAQSGLWLRIEGEDLSFVVERLSYEGQLSSELSGEAEIEFKKFVFLVGVRDAPLAMIGPAPDAVWHQFILFTREYEQFCRRTVGFFVDHLPDTPMTPVPQDAGENFLRAYEEYFGNLPEVWFDGMNAETVSFYQSRPLQGSPPMRWSGWAPRQVDRHR